MPYYGHIYYSYGDFLANNLYVLLLIPVLLLSLWAASPAPRRRRRCCGPTGSSACLSGPAGEI